MAQRIRKVASEKELDQIVDDYITQGYKVKSRGESTVNVKKSEYGSAGIHIIVFILTCWFTFGLGNLVYALLSNSKGDTVLVRLNRESLS